MIVLQVPLQYHNPIYKTTVFIIGKILLIGSSKAINNQ
jgi:hypothetical protein